MTKGVVGGELARVLLEPASIALVGVSDDAAKTAGRPLAYLRRSGFAGTVYPVNPRATVQGERSYPDLASLPRVPEHVFVLTATENVLPTVEECGRLGVKVVTVLASGFAESGPAGFARERTLAAIAARTGTRVLGPSSLGVVSLANGLVLTANAAFAEPEPPRGKIFVASQSGSMIGALVSRGKARGTGFAGLVSVGGECDLSIGEICHSTLDRPAIEGYVIFLESLRHGPALRAFALEAARRGKPVIVYKLGRSAAAAEMAATHTGALAGDDAIADAFFRDLGCARVEILDSLLEVSPLAARMPLAHGMSPPRRVGIVTTTGGGAAMVVDQLGIRGITVERPSSMTQARLESAGIQGGGGRIVDLTLAGTRYEVMKGALDVLLDAPEFDMVVAVVGSSARYQPHLAVEPIVDSAGHAKPLAAMLVPDAPEALAALTAAGVPCFRSPEACADSIAALFRRRFPGAQPGVSAAPGAGAAEALSEADAYGVLDAIGVPRAAFQRMTFDAPETLPFPFPVVAKICSARIPHKTEVGGVVLDIRNDDELAAALRELRTNVRLRVPEIACDDVLVQPMCRGLAEVLIGYQVHPEAGPVVMLAAGGIWAEVLRDRSLRLAPVQEDVAREMIAEVRSLGIVSGLRGKSRGDLDALARAIVALSRLAVRPDLQVVEAEVNPLLVMADGDGCLAIDALVHRRRGEGTR